MTRRQVLKVGMIGGAGLVLPWKLKLGKAYAVPQAAFLNDPEKIKKFLSPVPDALYPSFIYSPVGMGSGRVPHYEVGVSAVSNQFWGVKELPGGGTTRLYTDIYGYGMDDAVGYTWPGRTFEVQSNRPIQVQWINNLEPNGGHLFPVDETLHWCYSLPGYTRYSLSADGVPIVVHVHGHHSQYRADGNPEEFFTYRWRVKGPRFRGRTSIYDNSQPAGNLWYHDHALGITRLNVYAGMAGFYFVRDDMDTGLQGNPLDLPAHPYEKAYAIQDRMFRTDGQLFYPAYPGDPAYEGFITDEGVTLHGEPNNEFFPYNPNNYSDDTVLWDGGGPTALAEFFGDHMVVNGRAWPKEDVERRNYRLHLLNGCDSRFMVIRFRLARLTDTTIYDTQPVLNFDVIGSDQGLSSEIKTVDHLVFEPGSRYDIIFDFKQAPFGTRVIMENIGGDVPFNGLFGEDLDEDEDFFENRQTDRIMAFDVIKTLDTSILDVSPTEINFGPNVGAPDRYRKVALFEGSDEFGRLQPLLGTVGPATDFIGRDINWPNTQPYIDAGLTGPMEGAIAWHSPTTENPALNTTEEWEVWNGTGDAHPVHLHLVHFEIVARYEIEWDSATNEEDRVLDPDGITTDPPVGDGTYLVEQPVVQHNGETGFGFKLMNWEDGVGDEITDIDATSGYVENARHDMVTALPDQITVIRARFDKPGRFVWHCHILSHEDHEMMRTLYVGPETGSR